jgi:Zn-dependent peptidase ImmA (M78 family)
MVHLLESRGVRVFSLAEECIEVDAFSFWRAGQTPYIFLNTMKTAEHSRMDAAHELGHLVLHWGHDAPQGREAEHQANLFASAFLMPHGSVLAHVPKGANLTKLIEAKRRWKVSLGALVYRMHRLQMLTDWQYRSLFIEMGRRGYRTKEPNGIPRETSQVVAKVFKSLHDDGVTRTDIARMLHVPADELARVVFGLVMTSVEGAGQPDASVPAERPSLKSV